jgi:hypothetical protein
LGRLGWNVEQEDLNIFVERPEGCTAIRRLRGEQLDAYKGDVYRIERGDKLNILDLRLFRRANKKY